MMWGIYFSQTSALFILISFKLTTYFIEQMNEELADLDVVDLIKLRSRRYAWTLQPN